MKSHLPEVTARLVEAMMHTISTHPEINTATKWGAAIGVDKATVSRWGSGSGNTTLDDVINASDVFGYSLDWICKHKGEMYLTRLEQLENRLTRIEKAFNKASKKVSKKKQ